jgi:hypothetical protein
MYTATLNLAIEYDGPHHYHFPQRLPPGGG